MGWRADQAYEDSQRDDYRRWRDSLTLPQFGGFHLHRARHVLLGASVTVAVIVVARILLG